MFKPTDFQKTRSARIALHADQLYDFLPDTCGMTEKNMADALGLSLRELRLAKQQLVTSGRITVGLEQNGRRANPKHVIQKVIPNKPNNTHEDHHMNISWKRLSEFRVQDVNELPVIEQVELYLRIGLNAIPMHFPKFNRGSVYCSCSAGKNCPSIGKHPALQWKSLDFFDRRTASMLFAYWREIDARFNIGLITKGFGVIDVDYRNGGQYSLQQLQEEVGELPAGLSALSGNGRHIYLEDVGLLSSATNVLGLPGLDIKAKGGVIVAPCSTHVTGNEYRWETIGVPEPLPKAWALVLQEQEGTSRAETGRGGTLAAVLERGDVIPVGKRNDTLFRIACRERGNGAKYESILTKLQIINGNYCRPPLKHSALIHIAKSAARYPTEREKRWKNL